MTFAKFEKLFLAKYPEGGVCAHGKFGGTERSRKVGLWFREGGKGYEYYGAYEDILCKVGIPTCSKARLHEIEATLKRYKEWHGSKGLFEDSKPLDYSREIAEWEKMLADVKANYTIV